MTLLEQFLAETRDALHGISAMLMALESRPDDSELMTGLFRLVHTLKGNSGLFDYPEMSRVLHATEDVMDAVRQGQLGYSTQLADLLLDTMDFVGALCDGIENGNTIDTGFAADSAQLATSLRQLIGTPKSGMLTALDETLASPASAPEPAALLALPQALRMAAYRSAAGLDGDLHWLCYVPDEQCFFQGDDPFFQARGTPQLLWGSISASTPWPNLVELDAYRCVLRFHMLTSAPRAALDQHYRYMVEQVEMTPLPALLLVLPQGVATGDPFPENFVLEALDLLDEGELDMLAKLLAALRAELAPNSWRASALEWLLLLLQCEPQHKRALVALIEALPDEITPDWRAVMAPPSAPPPSTTPLEPLAALIDAQRRVLQQLIPADRQTGRSRAVAAALGGILRAGGANALLPGLTLATEAAVKAGAALPLLAWMDQHLADDAIKHDSNASLTEYSANSISNNSSSSNSSSKDMNSSSNNSSNNSTGSGKGPLPVASTTKADHRHDDSVAHSVKVDQARIDQLMNLIGEMMVAKNALPYLANRAETVFGARELSRDIKSHYLVIHRIVEEMQGAIMQVRMMPVSFVFQRFPRLVRDISRKLGKQVELVLEGEDTEADKNIIEALGDPLVHIVRNSLDHGFELPQARAAAGKPAGGRLSIRAAQEADRVVIEIRDDGKGIDPDAIKRKALERGMFDLATLEHMSEQELINLVFAAGFSTAETVSDLSGRGVGMDVVRAAVERANGSLQLESRKGVGTCIRLSVPLSMAVSNVIIVEADGQRFGLPIEQVIETVRVPRAKVRGVKHALTTVLRKRIVPLKSLHSLLGLAAAPKANAQDELAVLVLRVGGESVGLLVDAFHQTVDIILKPMTGLLGGLSGYAGSALMGDGSVLMVLDVKELI